MKNIRLLFFYMVLLSVIGLSIINEGFSQAQTADSLLKVISKQADDQEKADNLVKLGRLYYYINQDSSFLFIVQAYNLSKKLNYLPGQADALYLESVIYKGMSDYDSSLSKIEKYNDLAIQMKDSLRLAKGYYYLGNIYLAEENIDLATFYSQKSLAFSLAIDYISGQYANYSTIGNMFKIKSNYDSAAYYYLKAIDLCEKSGDLRNLSTVLNNLGDIYLLDKQYENARKCFNQSLEINRENGKASGMALNFTNLGRVASEMNEYREALNYYNQAEKIYTDLEDYRGLADIDNNIGDVYFKQMKFDLALAKFNKALEGYRNIPYNKGIILATINKSAVLSELGKIKLSMAMQDSCLVLADSLGGKALVLQALRNISNNYYKTGKFKNAFEYLNQYYSLKDSIFTIEKSKAISELELKYNNDQILIQYLEIKTDNLQKTKERNVFLFSGLGILVLALSIIVYFRQKAAHNMVVAQQKIHQLEEEKKLMGAKLLVEGQEEERKRIATELHDGLGVLLSATKMQFSTISDKSPENKEMIDKATRMLEQATGDVRKISHNMMPGLLTKLGFFEAAEDLFEHIGDTKGLNAVCTISGNQDRLPENKEIMLYRIVQEMANNTLKHAEARNIELQIQTIDGMLVIKYADDGKGFDFEQKMESQSLGLKSIQSRVDFLNGKLSVKSKPGEGVKYTIQIPS